MSRVFLLTGSNLGDTISILKTAKREIEKELGKVVHKSHIYRSAAWGYKSSGLFYNQCMEIETILNPHSIIEKILEIEAKMGRIRVGRDYSDREIDIDVLFYGEEIINDDILIIPHPRMHLRKFALVPMSEIAGDFLHPVFKKTISELLNSCLDESIVSIAFI